MTLYEFKLLDEAEQVETFWNSEVIVGEYSQDGFDYECRQVDDFYIEYKTKGKQYLDMKCHRNPGLLDKYLGL